MKKFLLKLGLLSSPILVFFLIPVVILIYTGENFFKIESALDRKYLVGYGYNEVNYNYLKWVEIKNKQKNELLALGSSRVLPFRRNMFDVSFYNAGFTISSISDFRPFLNSISSEKYPSYLIIGLDQWMFNENWDNMEGDKFIREWQTLFHFFPTYKTIKNVYNDLLTGKLSGMLVPKESDIYKIGLNAIINDKGFRNDGSLYYGTQIRKLLSCDSSANDYLFKNTHERINEGKFRFEFGDQLNPLALSELEKILKFCHDKGIYVVGFLPPFAEEIYRRLKLTNNHSYISLIYPKISPVFKKYDFELYDYSSVHFCHSNDQETIDGFHGGEMTYQKMLIDMVRKKSKLVEITNLKRLEADLSRSTNNYIIYSY